MAATLTLAKPDDAERLLPMIEAFHAEENLPTSAEHRSNALQPLLEGTALGEVYLIGPKVAPIGYIVITHGYSIEFGGPDAFIDEFYLRPGVRGRGVGGEIMQSISEHLTKLGTRALHLEVSEDNTYAQNVYAQRGFSQRSKYKLMTRELFR